MNKNLNSFILQIKDSLYKKYGYQLNLDIFLKGNSIPGLIIKRRVIIGLAIAKYAFLTFILFNILLYFRHDFGIMYVLIVFIISILSVFLGAVLGLLEATIQLKKSLEQVISSAYTFTTDLLNDAQSLGFTSSQFVYDFFKAIMSIILLKGLFQVTFIRSERIQNKVMNMFIQKSDSNNLDVPLNVKTEDSKYIELVNKIKEKLELHVLGILNDVKRFLLISGAVISLVLILIIFI